MIHVCMFLLFYSSGYLNKKNWPPLQPPVSFPSQDEEYPESGDQEGDSPTGTNRFDPPPPTHEYHSNEAPPPHHSTHTEL